MWKHIGRLTAMTRRIEADNVTRRAAPQIRPRKERLIGNGYACPRSGSGILYIAEWRKPGVTFSVGELEHASHAEK